MYVNQISGHIRNASVGDLQEILELLEINKLPTVGIQKHIQHFLVWENTSRTSTASHIGGCVGLELYGKNALLRSLSIHPQYQKHGIGSQLLNSIIQHAKMMESKVLFLLTTTAEGFFEKYHFHSISRDNVPLGIKESIEFKSACPSTASCMIRKLDI